MAVSDQRLDTDPLTHPFNTGRVTPIKSLRQSPEHSLLPVTSDSNAVRQLHLGGASSPQKFCSNQICTSKYSLVTWAPKSLLLQFKRAANVYFLIISILSFMSFSPKSPVSMVGTFSAVIFFTMLKEGFEDIFRHIQDRTTNLEPVSVLDRETRELKSVRTQDIRVLDLVKVEDNHQIPADLILLVCANPQGLAFLNTMNLDGETNLKEKTAHENTKKLTDSELCALELDIECDVPGPNLHKWNCNVRLWGRDWLPLSPNQLLLRGCVLKNTGYVIGLVAYTGPDTKIMRNSKSAPSKVSHVLRTMNKMLYTIFILQAFICFLYSGLFINWTKKNAEGHSYLNVDNVGGSSYVIQVLTFYVAYSHLIPISLYVMLEIVKLYLSRLINWDRELYYSPDDRPASCRTSDLVEELGQVDFIFSDKTGTLTRNVMEFKKCAVNETVYDAVSGTGIIDRLKTGSDLEKVALDRLFTQLALCHSVFPTELPEGGFSYQAASPDELALVQGSARFSYIFCGKEDDRMSLRRNSQVPEVWQVIAEIPFDSTRKRMSLLLKSPSGRTLLMCKGADTVMFPLLKQGQNGEKVKEILDEFAREGLRTLVIAQKYLEEQEMTEWVKVWKTVMLSNAGNKDQLIDEQGSAIETDLELVGVTAIEDKLQEGVPETIKLMMEAAIRVWVLTGDKQETAIEIGKSCHLLTPQMQLEDLSAGTRQEFVAKLKSCREKYVISNIET